MSHDVIPMPPRGEPPYTSLERAHLRVTSLATQLEQTAQYEPNAEMCTELRQALGEIATALGDLESALP